MKKYILKNFSGENQVVTSSALMESEGSGVVESGLIGSGFLDSGFIESGFVPEPDPDEPENDDNEGLDSHHYTEEQMFEMMENGTWNGG